MVILKFCQLKWREMDGCEIWLEGNVILSMNTPLKLNVERTLLPG